MGDEEAAQKGGLVEQAKAKINKKAKDAVTSKLEANFAKIREHEVAKRQADKAIELLMEDNSNIVSEYEAGLV